MLRAAAILIALLGLTTADWELYKKVHGKSYSHDEDHLRRVVFMKNVAKINAHNLRHDLGLTTYRLGLNQLTDLTTDELRALRGSRMNASETVSSGQHYKLEVFDNALPETVDWRAKGYVTPVKDQGQCLSCWAFSATGSLEGQHFRATGELVSLSEQNLVDCSSPYRNMGCRGGYVNEAFTYIKENGGINTEESYPYTAKDGQCQFKSNSIGTRVSGFVEIPSGDERALQRAVATVGPVSVTIDASKESFQQYREGVYDEPNCSPTVLDHAVLVVGYGTEDGVDYWLVKNSWNTVWGSEGYIKMSRNKDNQCGIATQSSYPIV